MAESIVKWVKDFYDVVALFSVHQLTYGGAVPRQYDTNCIWLVVREVYVWLMVNELSISLYESLLLFFFCSNAENTCGAHELSDSIVWT